METASRHDQRVSSAPASVSVVTADEIRAYGFRTLADVLRSLRGVFTSYDRDYTYLGIRGFQRPGDFNSRVLLLVDGHRMNENVYDSSYFATEFPLDLDLVERVEFVRGPGSALYGGNAVFGVINVITRRPDPTRGVELSTSAGSFGTYGMRATYGYAAAQGPQVLLSASGYRSDGPALDPSLAAGARQTRGLDTDRNASVFLSARSGPWTLLSSYGSRDKRVPTGAYGSVFDDPENGTTDQRGFVELAYSHPLSPDWSLTARGSFDDYEYQGRYVFTTSPEVVNRDSSVGQWLGAEAHVVGTVSERHHLVLGFEARENLRQDQKNFDRGGAVYFEDHRSSVFVGLFGQAELQLHPRLNLVAGLRADHYTSFGEALSPRAALIYSPFESTTLKALWGRAFRPPNALELYYNYPTGYLPSQVSGPETVDTSELVLEQDLGASLRLTGSLYDYRAHHLIGLISNEASGQLLYRNLNRVESVGTEWELEKRWRGGVQARVSYAFQRGDDSATSAPPVNSPAHLAKLHLNAPLYWRDLRGGLEVLYVASRRTMGGDVAPAFVLTNATLWARELLGGAAELSFSVYNLFDVRYSDPGSTEHPTDTIAQDGRTVRLKLLARF